MEEVDLGGLKVRQITSFQKIWTVSGGGPDNAGASFLDPSPIPDGFWMLGSYAQPNNKQLFGWVLVASDKSGDILKQPSNYTLIWHSDDNKAFFWLPTPPDGYKSLGLLVTATPDIPSLDRIRCVRSDFTADAEVDNWIWNHGMNVYGLRPKTRGTNAQPLSAGTFVIQSDTAPLSCLINKNTESTGRLNQLQMMSMFQTYAPYIYFHSDEEYLPSTVDWFFSNGALLYKKGESNPVRVEPDGANLPQGGRGDGTYWLDLPTDGRARDAVKKGDLNIAKPYIHFKPIFGGTFTDIQVWVFYPFNGHATAKVGFIKRLSMGRVGEHVGDWEHVTLRVSNFNGILYGVYLAQHSGGKWVDASTLEYESGNKFAVYASRNGHAANDRGGLYLQGGNTVGIRNDWEKSGKVMDTGARFLVVSAEAEMVVEPPWLNFNSKWGPTKDYDTASEVRKLKKWLPGKLKKALMNLVKVLDQVFGMDGPAGPKTKASWNGDES
ncbi:DUF946 family protein [Perilla frutescens var. frutescens]|nr:DUF946 family protein [Perilla frutescens var. frutescens]